MMDAKIRDIKYALDNLTELIAESGISFSGIQGYYQSGWKDGDNGVQLESHRLIMEMKLTRSEKSDNGVEIKREYILKADEESVSDGNGHNWVKMA